MCGLGDPLQIISKQREELRRLCIKMENVADMLPAPPGRATFQWIHSTLKQALPIFNRNEETLYSLIVAKYPESVTDSVKLISLIQAQHKTHIAFADEFDELFLEDNGTDAELGYILRYFFETLSNHLDWEDAVMMPLAEGMLNKDDFSLIAKSIAIYP